MLFSFQALSFIEVIGESLGHYSALPLYNCFLRACAKRQSMKHVDLCLDLMDSRGVKKNEITYRELLKVCKGYRSHLIHVIRPQILFCLSFLFLQKKNCFLFFYPFYEMFYRLSTYMKRIVYWNDCPSLLVL